MLFYFLQWLFQAAIGAAVVNIQIPVLLGEVTNIVSKYASDATTEVSSFLAEVRNPVVKLCSIYGLQVGVTFLFPIFFIKMYINFMDFCETLELGSLRHLKWYVTDIYTFD